MALALIGQAMALALTERRLPFENSICVMLLCLESKSEKFNQKPFVWCCADLNPNPGQ